MAQMGQRMTRRKHPRKGGRRHGLSPAGSTPSTLVRLTPEQRAWLDEVARDRDVPVAQVMRDLVQAVMEVDRDP